MHDAVESKSKKYILSTRFNANLAVLCVQVTASGVYILSIIVNYTQDNLIRLLKLPVWETLDLWKFPYMLFWMAEKVHQDLLYKRKTMEKIRDIYVPACNKKVQVPSFCLLGQNTQLLLNYLIELRLFHFRPFQSIHASILWLSTFISFFEPLLHYQLVLFYQANIFMSVFNFTLLSGLMVLPLVCNFSYKHLWNFKGVKKSGSNNFKRIWHCLLPE